MSSFALLGCLVIGFFASAQGRSRRTEPEDSLMVKAKQLAREFIIIDTHIDAPERMLENEENLSIRTAADFDFVKAREGGLKCGFMAIYVPASYQKTGGARAYAERLIAMVEGWIARWPDKFVLVSSPSDVIAQSGTDKISLAMGMENAVAIEDDVRSLRHFYDEGIRYITLTHSKDNQICDSSFDTTGTWKGLSPFGRKVVEEMNRVGIMVDVSHISDSAFYQVMRVTRAPVIASHSSCRSFTPGLERNMSDDMIKLLAANGGVIQINFGSFFLDDDYRTAGDKMRKAIDEDLKQRGISPNDSAGREYAASYRRQHPVTSPDVSIVAAHIDHVVKLVGVDFVGLGSDFDGLGDNLPTGLKDASCYPNLIDELLKKGYTEEDLRKICSGNLLRVWSDVENVAMKLQKRK